ncbi:MAG: EamA family transporter, partial [Ruminiclostridium sp.]|nr:EamA family transporter [Ruminiclostridium sp.]
MKNHRGVLFGLLAGMLWGLDGVLLGRADPDGILRAALITACIHDGLAALWIFAVNVKNKK